MMKAHRLVIVGWIAGFDAVWELDLFGKFRREIEAARDDTQAARDARTRDAGSAARSAGG